jgi:hypothetical protein
MPFGIPFLASTLPTIRLGTRTVGREGITRSSSLMSAFGTKRSSQPRRSMSAFGGKADIAHAR